MRILIYTVLIIMHAISCYAKSIYVATDGNDATSYANNDIDHPWITIGHAFSTAQSGDIVYFRTGTYTISSKITGPAASDITFEAYNGESVTLSSSVTGTVFEITKSQIVFDGFTIIWTPGASTDLSEAGFFRLGYDVSATYFNLKNSIVSGNWCGDNAGVIHSRNTNGDYADIENNTFTHTESATCVHNGNTASIIMMYDRGWTISNNEFYGSGSQGGQAIYYKYGNTSLPGSTISNNYFKDCVGGLNRGLHTLSYGATFSNNVFDSCSDVTIGDSYQGSPAGTSNEFDHNTFFNTQLSSGTSSVNFSFTNNIVISNYYVDLADGPSIDNITASDYNLWPTGTCVRGPTYTNYDLAGWKTATSADVDLNSIAGSPTFVGGGSPTTIAEFALTSGSSGYHAASDSSDIGADVSLVGVDAGEEDTTAPVISSVAPSGEQSCTTTINETHTTDEAATCRIGANGAAWAAMAEMDTTGGTSHGHQLTGLSCDASYQYDIRCQDAATNESVADFDFSIAADAPAPGIPVSGCSLSGVEMR